MTCYAPWRGARGFNPHRPFRAGATPPYIVALLMGRKEVLRGDPPLGTLAQGLGTECPNRFSSSTTAFAALRGGSLVRLACPPGAHLVLHRVGHSAVELHHVGPAH